MGKVKVTKESETGRNTWFKDGNTEMTRAEFVKKIEAGKYDEYYVRKINGVKTPVSNPDKNSENNLDK